MNNEIQNTYYKIIGLPQPKDDPIEIKKRYPFIIKENKHKEVNIGQTALGYLKSKLKLDIIEIVNNNILKDKILQSWKHYDDFCINCMDKKLYLLKIDFNNHKKAESLIKKIDNEFPLNLESSMKEAYGLVIPLKNDSYIMMINNGMDNEENILHEFTHYVQLVTGILIFNGDIKNEVKSFFNLKDKYVNYVLNEYEFWTNIYNDLFNGLQKIYWKENLKNKYSWNDYISAYFIDLKIRKLNYKDTSIIKLWKEHIGDKLFYFDILSTIAYVKESFFDEIIEKLKNK